MRRRAIVICFGRFNPPHIGHQSLLEFTLRTAQQHHADVRVYPSQSQDPKKNPLPFREKVRFLKMLFPRMQFNDNTAIRTPIDALMDCARMGYTDVVVVAGSDRVESFGNIGKYVVPANSPKYRKDTHIPLQSYQVVVVPGNRDEDSTGVSGMSASKQRANALAGDFPAFQQGVPGQKDFIARALYTAVRQHMGVREEREYRERMRERVLGEAKFYIFESPVGHSPKTWQRGFLEVEDDGKSVVRVIYAGNMGASERTHVAREFDELFGKGSFAKVRPLGKIATKGRDTYSDPSYMYILLVPREKFYAVVSTRMHKEAASVSTPKPPSETDRMKVRQSQETIALKQRQANELMAAKLRDVQQKAREQQQKASAPKPASR